STGDVEVDRAPRDGGGTIRGAARVTYELPWGFHAGARGPLAGPWEDVADASYLTLSRQGSFDLRMYGGELADANVPDWYPRYRGLNDVLIVSAGVEGREHERVRLGARLRFETAGVSEQE